MLAASLRVIWSITVKSRMGEIYLSQFFIVTTTVMLPWTSLYKGFRFISPYAGYFNYSQFLGPNYAPSNISNFRILPSQRKGSERSLPSLMLILLRESERWSRRWKVSGQYTNHIATTARPSWVNIGIYMYIKLMWRCHRYNLHYETAQNCLQRF